MSDGINCDGGGRHGRHTVRGRWSAIPRTGLGEALTAAGEMTEQLAPEVAQIARARLIDVEVMLSDFWYDSIDHTPLVAARITVAARLVHKAVDLLAPGNLAVRCIQTREKLNPSATNVTTSFVVTAAGLSGARRAS